MKKLVLLSLLVALAPIAGATLSTTQTVSSQSNMFYTGWGHWYDEAADNAVGNPYSTAARSVNNNASPIDFAGFDNLSITAGGAVVDAGQTATGPDGDTCQPACLFNDGNFRGVRAYSLIGLWSRSGTAIDPIDDDMQTAPFLIGSSAELAIPDASSAYLFLAENDGDYSDDNGQYTVNLVGDIVIDRGTGAVFVRAVSVGDCRHVGR